MERRWRGWLATLSRRPEIVDVLLPLAVIRIALHVIAVLAGDVRPDSPVDVPAFLRVWYQWDVPHYLDIARAGYVTSDDPDVNALAVFFPLYPALIRLGSIVLPPLAAAMLISLIATIVGSLALYALVLLDDGADRPMARRAVIAMNLFPTSFALVAPYTEALFLALSIGALLAARLDRWASAGVLGLLAALTRIQGWLIGAVLLVDHLARRRLHALMLWILAAGVGPLVYLAINQLAYGDPLFFIGRQAEHFYHRFAPPWVVLGSLFEGIVAHAHPQWAILFGAPLAAFVLLGGVAAWTILSPRSRPAYAAYAMLSFLLLASVTWPISAPRYVGVVFPVFIALADVGRRRWLWFALMAASALLLVAFEVIFVRGRWAF